MYYEKIGHILKPLVPTFRPDLSVRFRDITKKQVLAELKPILVPTTPYQLCSEQFTLIIGAVKPKVESIGDSWVTPKMVSFRNRLIRYILAIL